MEAVMSPICRIVVCPLLVAIAVITLDAAFPGGIAAEAEDPPAVKTDAVVTDRYRDPLPPGAVARLGTVRFRHEQSASRLEFSLDGKALACNSDFVWDAATGKPLYRLGESSWAISPDWKTAAHVEGFTTPLLKIVLREVPSNKTIRELEWPKPDNQHATTRLQFTPDGKSIAVIYECEAFIIDAASGKVRTTIKSKLEIGDFRFSPDGNTLVLSTVANGIDNPTLQLRNAASGALIRAFDAPTKNGVQCLTLSPDGKTLAAGGWEHIVLFDVASGKEVGHFEGKRMDAGAGIAFTPDGKTLVSAGQDGNVRVWEVATGETRFTLDGRTSYCFSMALSPDGKTVALGADGSTVRLWNVETGKELFTEFVGHDCNVDCLTFSPDGKTLASGGNHDKIVLWSTASWKDERLIKDGARYLSFSPEGKRLSSVVNRQVHIWDVETGKDAINVPVDGVNFLVRTQFSADGLKLFTLDRTFGPPNNRTVTDQLRHWDAATGKQVNVWTLPRDMQSLLLFPDGKTAVAKCKEDVFLHNVESGRDRLLQVHQANGTTDRVGSVALSPDGKVLAGGLWSGTCSVRLWEVATGKEIGTLKAHERSVFAIAWSPDGRMVASSDRRGIGEDGVVRVWDMATSKQIAKFTGYTSTALSLAFSPNGAHLAGGLLDSTILVWDVGSIRPKLAPHNLTKGELEAHWKALGGDDPIMAFQSCWALVAAAEQSVPILRDRLKPVVAVDEAKVQKWIADLDSNELPVRDAATKELKGLGSQAADAIEKATKGTLGPETRKRLEQIAEVVDDVVEPKTLRVIRAVTVLEQIGSPEARAILQTLAKGAQGVRETEESKSALARLATRH
jgi:WD40 repeat protein